MQLVSMDENAPVRVKVGDFGLARKMNAEMLESLQTWQVCKTEMLL
jgi:hypothetical protein